VLPEPFAADLTARRRARVSEVLEEHHGAAALIVSDLLNLRYLTGFHGSNGALVIDGASAVLFTDSRYVQQAGEQAPGVTVELGRDVLNDAVRSTADRPTLVEGEHISAGRWLDLSRDHPRLALSGHLVEDLRTIKDEAETAALTAACEVSQSALEEILAEGVVGRTERAVARRLEWLLAEAPGEGPGFESIVAAGPNSAIPHHRPTDRPIEAGDLLKIDFGASVAGYHADITRTYVAGLEPAPWQRDLHAVVLAAQAAAMERAVPGAAIADVDAAARDLITQAGHAERFGHGLGHGVGLAIHERPLMGSGSDGTLAAGMAITIEPGVYVPGLGGIRIEDTVLVEDGGCRPLVTLSRDLSTVR
jgi:Xaa-Pro aminopeptidase